MIALRDIRQGEQLLFRYGGDYWVFQMRSDKHAPVDKKTEAWAKQVCTTIEMEDMIAHIRK